MQSRGAAAAWDTWQTLCYTVRRRDPELVGPAAQTPRETKHLSVLDHRMREHMALAFFYRRREDVDGGVHPAGVIRRALGEALVQYYPLAGRVRETAGGEGGRLVVDCTGEGVVLVEANADVKLADLEAAGSGLRPPFPCWDQLLLNVEDDWSGAVLNSPLLVMQVTRLLCGGFVLALRFSHIICDGIGIAQFLNGLGELARGLPSMTVTPVWSRELLVTPETRTNYDDFVNALGLGTSPPPMPAGDIMIMRSFIFSASDVAAIKKNTAFDAATTFDALAAFIWRARTVALEVPAGQGAPLAISANFRAAAGMNLPAGYYGNASPSTLMMFDAAKLRDGSLGDAAAMVRQVKAQVTAHYFRSLLDVLIQRRWFPPANVFSIADDRRIGFERVDFGWGTPVFAGPANTVFGVSFFVAVKQQQGQEEEDAVAVPIVLPHPAMDRFTAEVESLLLHYKLAAASTSTSHATSRM